MINFSDIGIDQNSDYCFIKYIVTDLSATSNSTKNAGVVYFGTIHNINSSNSRCGSGYFNVPIDQSISISRDITISVRMSGGGDSNVNFLRNSNGYAGDGSATFGMGNINCTLSATMQVYAKKI